MDINLDILLQSLKKIEFIGIILIWMSFLIGIKFPDWDFKMKIKHRNILTHSPFILWGMIYFYNNQKNVEIFRFVIMGFSLAMGIHMFFDFFPKGWNRGALIHFPWSKVCLGVRASKYFIFVTGIYGVFLSIKYSKNLLEVLIMEILGFYVFLKNSQKEEKFFRPFFIFFISILAFSASKYNEIGNFIINILKLIFEKIKFLF